MKSEVVREEMGFWKNDPLREDFENFIPKGFTTSQIHVLCANFVKSVKSSVAYLTKKNKKLASTSALASVRIAPKICQGQLQTIYSECPKFRLDPYTSGGVTAGRVNIVETGHKVFLILGETSSPSNKLRQSNNNQSIRKEQIRKINEKDDVSNIGTNELYC